MPKFVKDALYPATVYPPGRDPITFTPEDVRHYATRMSEMLVAGLQIPVSWEHQDKAKPHTKEEREARKAELTKLTLGEALSAKVHPDGYLETEIDVPSEEDAKRIPSVRYISPGIDWDYRDGTGRVWPGPSIVHLAVTPRPVQHKQKPFQRLSSPAGKGMLCLSLADYVRLGYGETDMAEENKEKEGDGENVVDAGSMLKKVKEVLGRIGLILGDDCSPENFLERVYVSAMTKEAADNPGASEGGSNEAKEVPSPVVMSLQARLLKKEKGDLQARVRRLFETGRIAKPKLDAMSAELAKQTLKLSLDGELQPTALLYRIEAFEEMPANAAWPATGTRLSLSDAREVQHPTPDDRKSEEEAGDEMASMVNGAGRKK